MKCDILLEVSDPAQRLMELYPRIFIACHSRHVEDPETKKLLTTKQASILDHLDDEKPISLNGLARHMGVTPATMCIAIDKLERKGYVGRERDQADRRRVLLRLTPAGKRLSESQSVLDPARVAEMLATLSESERDEGLRGLGRLAEAADRYLATRGQGWKDFGKEEDRGGEK